MKPIFKDKGYQLGSALGFAAGVGYAFYKKTGFMKGWGIAIIGSIVIGGIGYALSQYSEDKPAAVKPAEGTEG